MTRKLFPVFCLIAIAGCNESKPFYIAPQPNAVYKPNTAFTSFEDFSDPKFAALRIKYRLDTVFHGEKDEFKRILLLRNWISSHISISDFEDKYPGNEYAEGIIDAALKGQGFHCGHFMIVQNAIMNAYGYTTRCIGAGPGVQGGPDGHHGANEIWSNTYAKWFLSDAKYNHHFEKKGIPLSALEVRDEYLKNKAADIVLVKGPSRTEIAYDSLKNVNGIFVKRDTKDFARTFTWIEWEQPGNRFTKWPANSDDLNLHLMYADSYSNAHTWIWDGKPHWAYHTKFWIPVEDRNAIEWTPNTVEAGISVDKNKAGFKLSSERSNLGHYELSDAPGVWKEMPDTFVVQLNNASYEISLRAVNTCGVAGPEYKVNISR